MKKQLIFTFIAFAISFYFFYSADVAEKKSRQNEVDKKHWHAQYHKKRKELQRIDLYLSKGIIPPEYNSNSYVYKDSCPP